MYLLVGDMAQMRTCWEQIFIDHGSFRAGHRHLELELSLLTLLRVNAALHNEQLLFGKALPLRLAQHVLVRCVILLDDVLRCRVVDA